MIEPWKAAIPQRSWSSGLLCPLAPASRPRRVQAFLAIGLPQLPPLVCGGDEWRSGRAGGTVQGDGEREGDGDGWGERLGRLTGDQGGGQGAERKPACAAARQTPQRRPSNASSRTILGKGPAGHGKARQRAWRGIRPRPFDGGGGAAVEMVCSSQVPQAPKPLAKLQEMAPTRSQQPRSLGLASVQPEPPR